MPARHRIAALCAVLALAAPPAALAQRGAGDSQYQDPFAAPPATTAKKHAPDPNRTETVDDLGTATPEVVPNAPAAKTGGGSDGGFDALPVVAAALVVGLGGLALWRRPHARR